MALYKLVRADITKETEGLIVSGCNLSGANGSGLAGALKARWPMVYDRYMEKYNQFKTDAEGGDIFHHLGEIDIFKVEDKVWVGNAFTQKFYGYDGKRYADADAILWSLYAAADFCVANNLPLKTVKIGCDRGGLSWENEIEAVVNQITLYYPTLDITIFEW